MHFICTTKPQSFLGIPKFQNEKRFRFNPYISYSFRSIMNECEICFRRTDSFVVKVRMTPSDYASFFFSSNRCLNFIPNDSAPIRTKFSFRLNPFNSVKSFRMVPRHSPFSPNDSVPLRTQSEWFRRAFKRTGFRMIRKQISHSHGIIFIPNESETCIRVSYKIWVIVTNMPAVHGRKILIAHTTGAMRINY